MTIFWCQAFKRQRQISEDSSWWFVCFLLSFTFSWCVIQNHITVVCRRLHEHLHQTHRFVYSRCRLSDRGAAPHNSDYQILRRKMQLTLELITVKVHLDSHHVHQRLSVECKPSSSVNLPQISKFSSFWQLILNAQGSWFYLGVLVEKVYRLFQITREKNPR